nr:hypothetical protein [Thermococcus sp.]
MYEDGVFKPLKKPIS